MTYQVLGALRVRSLGTRRVRSYSLVWGFRVQGLKFGASSLCGGMGEVEEMLE